MNNVTVCIPTYNGERFLSACIESILSQTYKDYDILIVDDCSSDATISIAEEYSRKTNNIKILKNESNLGLVGNWNRCIDLAQGEWIKFVFHDDVIEPDCLEKMLAVADEGHPFIACRRDFIFDDVSEDVVQDYQKFLCDVSMDSVFGGKTDISGDDIVAAQIARGVNTPMNYFGEPTAMLLHRSVFTRFGKFNPALIQKCDLEYWLRVGINTGVRYIPETLAHFRVHGGATTAKNKEKKEFRAREFDHLILMYEHVYNPFFEKLRRADAKHERRLTEKRIAERARWLYNQMKLKRQAGELDADDALFDEWQALIADHPKLRTSIPARMLRFYDYLDSRLLWRLRQQ